MDINSLISGQQGVGLSGRPLHGHSLQQQYTEQHPHDHHHRTDAAALSNNPRPNLPPLYPPSGAGQQLQSAVVAPDQTSPLYASQRSPLSTSGHIHPTTPQLSSLSHTAHTQTPNRRLAHILSEQKRRENINSGFEELKGIVPSCRGCADSKAVILRKAVHYIQFLENELQKVKQSTSNSSGASDPPTSLSPRKALPDSGTSSSGNGVNGSRLSLSVPPSTSGAYGLPSETAMGEKQHPMPQHPSQTMRSPTQLHPPHPHPPPHPHASPPPSQPPIFQPQPRPYGDTWRRSPPHQAHVNLNRQQQNGYDRDEHYKNATSRTEWDARAMNTKFYDHYDTASRAATGYHRVSLKQEGASHRND